MTAFIDTPNTIGYTKEQDIARQRAQDAANVRLIVAAPAMLDALQRIATDPANARETALAAIATATGKT